MLNLNFKNKIFTITVILLVGIWCFNFDVPANAAGIKKTSQYNQYVDKEVSGIELDGRGVLERIENEVCVIADVLRPFARFVSYYSANNGTVIYRSKFTPGKFVGYRINSKREIIELYLFGE